MGSPIIGRTACPECGFAAAHVKESPKCIYRYCPECGSMHHAKTDRQKADLKGKMRAEKQTMPEPTPMPMPTPTGAAAHEPITAKATPGPTPTPTPTPKPAPTPTPEPASKRRGLFSF